MIDSSILNKDAGVSPVIGVILMVAITVILAAVIGTFVMDLTGNVSPPAQAGIDITPKTHGVQVTAVSGVNGVDQAVLHVNDQRITSISMGESETLKMDRLADGDKITVIGVGENSSSSILATHTVSKPDTYEPPANVETPDTTPVYASAFNDNDGESEANEDSSIPPSNPIGDVEGFSAENIAGTGGSATVTEAEQPDGTFEMKVGGVAKNIDPSSDYVVEFKYSSTGAGNGSTLAITKEDGTVLDSIHLENKSNLENRVFDISPEASAYISSHGNAYFILSEDPDYTKTTFNMYALRIYPT